MKFERKKNTIDYTNFRINMYKNLNKKPITQRLNAPFNN